MVTLGKRERPTIGDLWIAKFTEEDFTTEYCAITKQTFEIGEKVLVCGECGAIFKKNTEDIYKQQYPCKHNKETQYYNCTVELEK